MLRKEAEARRTQWASALSQIASETGKASPLTDILGTVAWGRYNGEPSATDSKDNALIGYGFLMGVRYAAMRAAERFKLDGGPSSVTFASDWRGRRKMPKPRSLEEYPTLEQIEVAS